MGKRIKKYAYYSAEFIGYLMDVIGWMGIAVALLIGGIAGYIAGRFK